MFFPIYELGITPHLFRMSYFSTYLSSTYLNNNLVFKPQLRKEDKQRIYETFDVDFRSYSKVYVT